MLGALPFCLLSVFTEQTCASVTRSNIKSNIGRLILQLKP